MPYEPAVFITARTYYDQGDYQKAVESWPRPFAEHRRALKRLIHTGADKRKAYISVDGHIKRLFVSAYQSDIFNRVLTVRMPLIDRLLQGDMAMKHENGACFRVEDLQAEQPRCDCFEISPTGPILGKRMTELIGPAGEIENPIIQEARKSLINAPDLDKHIARGGRRPLRFQPQNAIVSAGQDERGDYIELKFNLDSGCYATIMLREITKSPDE
jgi:tRNA pseudouridine13 synthase